MRQPLYYIVFCWLKTLKDLGSWVAHSIYDTWGLCYLFTFKCVNHSRLALMNILH